MRKRCVPSNVGGSDAADHLRDNPKTDNDYEEILRIHGTTGGGRCRMQLLCITRSRVCNVLSPGGRRSGEHGSIVDECEL